MFGNGIAYFTMKLISFYIRWIPMMKRWFLFQ